MDRGILPRHNVTESTDAKCISAVKNLRQNIVYILDEKRSNANNTDLYEKSTNVSEQFQAMNS